jgi:membrane fusion protein, heavy metal efflux system
MTADERRLVGWVLICSLLSLVIGLLAGYSWLRLQAVAPAIAVEDDHDDHDHEDHVDISSTAYQNLGLRLGVVERQSFLKRRHLPATVVEKPGQSGLSVTAPIQGVVREVFGFPGQSLQPGDVLFRMQVTDQALEAAQLSLLEILTRITVTEREIARLDPLTEAGAVIGRRKLELEYQLKQLEAERAARLQELRLRGLSSPQIERIVADRELIDQLEVVLEVPGNMLLTREPVAKGAVRPVRWLSSDRSASIDTIGADSGPIYTVEKLDVFPGRAVLKGEQLCHVAQHAELLLRGEAFEEDVPAVRSLAERDWEILAEFGQGEGRFQVEGLAVSYVDNHVDPDSQTFPFYLDLPNRVMFERQDATGRLFRSWLFKPGQRAHLYLPVAQWSEAIVLPREAVVWAGPSPYVFRLHMDDFELPPELDAAAALQWLEQRPEFEFEPVEVHVLHRDSQSCVIEPTGLLRVGEVIAINQAYQLYLAWRMQLAGGGGGHDHDH